MPGTNASSTDDIKEQHPLLFASDTPDLKSQFDEFQRAGGLSTVMVQRDRNERIRFNRWKGRSSDYRKHQRALGKAPVPYENAWDGRVFLADGIIEDLGDVLSSAESRAQLKSKPTEAGDITKAAQVDRIANKFRDRMRPDLKDEGEFLWQFGLGQGATILQVGWDYQLAMRNQKLSMEKIVQAAQQALEALQQMPPAELGEVAEKMQQLAILPQLIMDPLMEQAAMEIFQTFAREMAAQLYTQERADYGDEFLLNYQLSATKARHMVRELRTKAHTSMPQPYVAKNEPFVTARELGYDYFCPPEMTRPQDSPWHAVREWLTPEQVWAGQICDGWDRKWCIEAIKTAGMTSEWTGSQGTREGYEMDDETDSYNWTGDQGKSGLIEVVHFIKRYLSPEGIPQIKCTVWCPHVLNSGGDNKDLFAKHYDMEDLRNRYPFAGYRWQQKHRQFANSMGVPQIVGSDQHAIKTSLDMLMDLEQQTVSPQWLVDSRMGLKFKTGSGAQIPRKRPGDIEMVQPPSGHPELAFNLQESAMERVSNYFGLMNKHVLPAKWQSKLQRMTEKYLGTWSEAWGMMLELIFNNVPPAELERIAGGPLEVTAEDIANGWDLSLFFDVKDLDMEFVFKKLDAVIKMAVPLDRKGMMDFGKLEALILNSIDPTYATALLSDQKGASQAVFNDVRNQVALMERGNAPDFVEMDPTAETKLQFTQEIIQSNPLYMAALNPQSGPEKFNPVFAKRLQQWEQNLQQSLKQQENRTIGKLGVNPELNDNSELTA